MLSGAVAALQHTWVLSCWSVSTAVGAENKTDGTARQVGALWEGTASVHTLPSCGERAVLGRAGGGSALLQLCAVKILKQLRSCSHVLWSESTVLVLPLLPYWATA